MDVVRFILDEMPYVVTFEGVHFKLELFPNHSNDFRICYAIFMVDENSKHYKQYVEDQNWLNPFTENNCDFLVFIENIESQDELINDLKFIKEVFISKNII